MPDLTIRMIKEDFDILREHAARAGMPVRKVAREALREYLERHASAIEPSTLGEQIELPDFEAPGAAGPAD